MTKKEWIEEIQQLAAACRSFQHAYSLDESEDYPQNIEELWNLCESVDIWSQGKWIERWERP
jgi:hypothetical protein